MVDTANGLNGQLAMQLVEMGNKWEKEHVQIHHPLKMVKTVKVLENRVISRNATWSRVVSDSKYDFFVDNERLLMSLIFVPVVCENLDQVQLWMDSLRVKRAGKEFALMTLQILANHDQAQTSNRLITPKKISRISSSRQKNSNHAIVQTSRDGDSSIMFFKENENLSSK